MAELATWRTVGTWITKHILQWLPDRLLRLVWSQERLLAKIELFHFNSAPQFQVRSNRLTAELSGGGFNVFNWSPFKLTIVAVDLRISINSQEFHRYDKRFASEIQVQPFARSGFYYEWALKDSHVRHVREFPKDCARIRVEGHMIIRTVFGELRKKFQSDVLADIDR